MPEGAMDGSQYQIGCSIPSLWVPVPILAPE